MEKLNIAELLEDCPWGIKLYSPIFGDVYLDKIRPHLAVVVRTPDGQKEEFLYDGRFGINGECMLFPSKENRDWSTFKGPFKDGDILAYNNEFAHPTIFIYRYDNPGWNTSYFVALSCFAGFLTDATGALSAYNSNVRFATKEEKEKLFKAIKDNGYRWNAETKTLEKLIIPKFQVGDRIKLNNSRFIFTITDLLEDRYRATVDSNGLYEIEFERQDAYKLVPNKFDISTLKPFESRVLVRNVDHHEWKPAFWGYYSKEYVYPFVVAGGNIFAQCIPYEGNEHLRGTTDECDEYYKTWK